MTRLLVLVPLLAASMVGAQPAPEAFSGSFRLETGEVLTGGYFVENAVERFLYLDTDRLAKGGLFERTGDLTLRSIFPEGLTLEFVPGTDGTLQHLRWHQGDAEPLRGTRIARHTTQPIAFRSADGTPLRGDLLIPACGGPHPLVVSVHGSGPANRYGGPFTTFFLQHGIAVLTYDKRGVTADPETWAEPDLSQLAEDAAAAVRFAARRPEIDRARVGLFGSSQGGWVAPMAIAAVPETGFLLVRAGSGVNESETYLHERRQELRIEGLHGMDLDHAMALQAELHRLAMRGAPISAADDLVAPYLDTAWYRTAFGEGPLSARWSARWWSWMQRNFAVEPGPHLERFGGPVLWFLGEADQNVPLVSSRVALERAFAAAPGGDHELVVLDHAFLVYPEEGPPHYTHGFWNRMRDWLDQRGLTGPSCP